jgi:hypothetical protein
MSRDPLDDMELRGSELSLPAKLDKVITFLLITLLAIAVAAVALSAVALLLLALGKLAGVVGPGLCMVGCQ